MPRTNGMMIRIKLSLLGNILLFNLLTGISVLSNSTEDYQKYLDNFKAFTVATNETDGFKQFLKSTRTYNLPVEVLGFGRKWEGGDMRGPGGGFKVNLLREALEPYKDNDQQIIIFTDSYDALYLCGVSQIVQKFLAFDARIVFSAEVSLWPDTRLIIEYPQVEAGYRFLNSGGFIGYVNTIYKMLEQNISLANDADDQLFYTKIYLDEHLRNSLKIKLDHTAEIFQNLFAASNDIQLLPEGNTFEMNNILHKTKPCMLHGNGRSKCAEFRSLGNYLAGRWKIDEGCKDCDENIIKLQNMSIGEYPNIVVAVFIAQATPFFGSFIERIFKQNYPKRKIFLFVHNAVLYHEEEIDELLLSHNEDEYADIKLIRFADAIDTVTARGLAIDYCVMKSCDAYFNVDSNAHLDNEETLMKMVEQNRSIVAPLLVKPYTAWSNFWGAIDSQGYYRRSFDYMDIVYSRAKGVWNVPYLSTCYLINATILKNPELKPTYFYPELDYEMAFSSDMRNKGVYLYVDNRQYFGHLTELDGFNATKTNPNLYELFRNRWDWHEAYIHPDYYVAPDVEYLQPCPDVYSFPIVSPRFCEEFIEIMEEFGQWSDASTNDTQLEGGYEAVPTKDVHMNQVGLEEHWLEFLRLYVTPLQQIVFNGYLNDPPKSLMNFVVRYKPDEQPLLKTHNNASTYIVKMALSEPDIDYEGGGWTFLRYKCQMTNLKLGWMLMHPGKLTHSHEGLPVTKGVRYDMVSFIDP